MRFGVLGTGFWANEVHAAALAAHPTADLVGVWGRDLAKAKAAGERWPMLTAYDYTSARIFDQAGIPVLLVGDSAANVVYGYDTTVPITIDELMPLVRAVVRGTTRAFVVADLPFGTYRSSPEQALATAIRFMKEGGAQAVKLEGGAEIAPHIRLLTQSGIPVMAHVGLTPQSVNTLGGYKVQGRGEGGESGWWDVGE